MFGRPRPRLRTVYILGAGANRLLHEFYGTTPPLSTEVFKVGSAIPAGRNARDSPLYRDLFAFLAAKRGVRVEDLGRVDLSIEDCFDWTVESRKAAELNGDREEVARCEQRRVALLGYFCGVLSEFPAATSPWLYDLAGAIWRDQAEVLTFNYDSLLEGALQIVSGRLPSSPADDEIEERWRAFNATGENRPEPVPGFRVNEWERHTRYWVPFDQFELPQPAGNEMPGSAEFFQAIPSVLRTPKFLKLHGSVDWFRTTAIPARPRKEAEQSDLTARAGRLILKKWAWHGAGPFFDWPNEDGVLLDPIIATGSDKGGYLRSEPLAGLWRLAAEALRECERLVVIGFSFAAADQPARELVKRSIDRSRLKEAIWVQPSTRHAVDRARELDIRQDARFPTVVDYLRAYYTGGGPWYHLAEHFV